MNTGGGEADDPLGLDVEGDGKFPEDQLMVIQASDLHSYLIKNKDLGL